MILSCQSQVTAIVNCWFFSENMKSDASDWSQDTCHHGNILPFPHRPPHTHHKRLRLACCTYFMLMCGGAQLKISSISVLTIWDLKSSCYLTCMQIYVVDSRTPLCPKYCYMYRVTARVWITSAAHRQNDTFQEFFTPGPWWSLLNQTTTRLLTYVWHVPLGCSYFSVQVWAKCSFIRCSSSFPLPYSPFLENTSIFFTWNGGVMQSSACLLIRMPSKNYSGWKCQLLQKGAIMMTLSLTSFRRFGKTTRSLLL